MYFAFICSFLGGSIACCFVGVVAFFVLLSVSTERSEHFLVVFFNYLIQGILWNAMSLTLSRDMLR